MTDLINPLEQTSKGGNSYLHRGRDVFIEDYSPSIVDDGHATEGLCLSDEPKHTELARTQA
jgi:hypothetical protein